MNVIYLALRDSAENLKACFRLDECGIDDASDILHSLQTVVKKHILSLPSVENLDKKIKKVSTYAAHSTKFTGELKKQQKLLDPECTPLVFGSISILIFFRDTITVKISKKLFMHYL